MKQGDIVQMHCSRTTVTGKVLEVLGEKSLILWINPHEWDKPMWITNTNVEVIFNIDEQMKELLAIERSPLKWGQPSKYWGLQFVSDYLQWWDYECESNNKSRFDGYEV